MRCYHANERRIKPGDHKIHTQFSRLQKFDLTKPLTFSKLHFFLAIIQQKTIHLLKFCLYAKSVPLRDIQMALAFEMDNISPVVPHQMLLLCPLRLRNKVLEHFETHRMHLPPLAVPLHTPHPY